MPRTKEKQLLWTAYHEAGHAVAAIALGVKFRSLSVVPSGDSAGHLLCKHPPTFRRHGHWMSVWIAKQIMVLMGGMVAERLVHRGCVPGSIDDLQKAAELARILNGDSKATQVRRTLEFFRQSTVTLLWSPSCRNAVDYIARTLVDSKHLCLADCERLVVESTAQLEFQWEEENLELFDPSPYPRGAGGSCPQLWDATRLLQMNRKLEPENQKRGRRTFGRLGMFPFSIQQIGRTWCLCAMTAVLPVPVPVFYFSKQREANFYCRIFNAAVADFSVANDETVARYMTSRQRKTKAKPKADVCKTTDGPAVT